MSTKTEKGCDNTGVLQEARGGNSDIWDMEAGSVYFDMGRFLTTPCYEMFPKGLVWAENVWEDIGEQRTGQWALRGRDSRPTQSQQAALTLLVPPFTIFLTPSPRATRGMQAGEQLFLPSIHSSVCVCVRDLKTERKLTSFDRLLVRTRPFLLVDGDSRISEHLYQIRKGHHFSCEFSGYSCRQTQLWRWNYD